MSNSFDGVWFGFYFKSRICKIPSHVNNRISFFSYTCVLLVNILFLENKLAIKPLRETADF